MLNQNELEKIQNLAYQKMQSGCSCAESVFWSILETDQHLNHAEYRKMASVFGGGIGDTGEELCGALSGAMLALSYFNGRTDTGTNNLSLMTKAQNLRELFKREIGPTQCKALRAALMSKFGEVNCRQVVAKTIFILAKIEIQ